MDGRNRRNTFLIVHPNMEALRKELTAGIATSGDDAAVALTPLSASGCSTVATAKGDSNWKGYEIPVTSSSTTTSGRPTTAC